MAALKAIEYREVTWKRQCPQTVRGGLNCQTPVSLGLAVVKGEASHSKSLIKAIDKAFCFRQYANTQS